MSLNSLLADLGLVERQRTGLDAQIDVLRNEIRRVAGKVSRQAGQTSDEWGHELSDFGREAAKQGAYYAGVASNQALRGVKAFQRDPMPAIAVVGTALLLAHLLRR